MYKNNSKLIPGKIKMCIQMHSISKLLNVHYIHKNLFSHINCHSYFIVFQILILPSSWDPKAPLHNIVKVA